MRTVAPLRYVGVIINSQHSYQITCWSSALCQLVVQHRPLIGHYRACHYEQQPNASPAIRAQTSKYSDPLEQSNCIVNNNCLHLRSNSLYSPVRSIHRGKGTVASACPALLRMMEAPSSSHGRTIAWIHNAVNWMASFSSTSEQTTTGVLLLATNSTKFDVLRGTVPCGWKACISNGQWSRGLSKVRHQWTIPWKVRLSQARTPNSSCLNLSPD